MNRTQRPTQLPGKARHERFLTKWGRHERGFTIIEMMVTLAVAAVLVAIAVPSFRYLTISNKLTTTANEMVIALDTARLEAVKRNNLVTVCSNTGNGSDTLGTACGTQTGAVYALQPSGTATQVRAGIVGIVSPISIQNVTRLNFSGQGLGTAVGATGPYSGPVADIFTSQISTDNHRCIYMNTGSVVRTCTVTGACPNAQPIPCNQ